MSKEHVLMIGPYPEWDMVELEARYTLHKLWQAEDKASFIAAHAPNIRAIATRGELGAAASLMQDLPRLELVSVYGVGTDAVDRSYAKLRGIAVTNTPDVLTEDVADIGIGLLLAAARKIPEGDAFVRSGRWVGGNMGLVTRVWGKRAGVVGMGRIGKALAHRLEAFACDIAYFSRSRHDEVPFHFEPDLLALARDVDFLLVTVAGGEGTRGLITGEVLAALGSAGIFVNISRGTTVDEAALLSALENRTIKAAGLDVFQNEPRIDPRFLKLDNVVLQPHHGSGTVETRQAMGKLVRDNLAAHFADQPLLTPVL